MVTTWIPGKCIFLGYTNPNIQVQLTIFISVELAFLSGINTKNWLFLPQVTLLLITFSNCLL